MQSHELKEPSDLWRLLNRLNQLTETYNCELSPYTREAHGRDRLGTIIRKIYADAVFMKLVNEDSQFLGSIVEQIQPHWKSAAYHDEFWFEGQNPEIRPARQAISNILHWAHAHAPTGLVVIK